MRRSHRYFWLAALAVAIAIGIWAGATPSSALVLSGTEILIASLKFAGVAVGTISTLWGMTKKLTFEDAEGNKHLTREGKFAFGLAVGAFLVAGAAASVELISANIKKQNQLIADAASAAAEAEKERKADEASAETRRMLFESEAMAELNEARRQADSAALRLLALEAASEQERRDAALALQVNRGTSANLGRTQLALGELERVLQPLGYPVLALEWKVRPDTPEKIAMLREIEQIAARARAGDPATLEALDIPGMSPEFAKGIKTIAIRPSSSLYPGSGTIAQEVVRSQRSGAMFAPKGAAGEMKAILASTSARGRSPLGERGDIRFYFSFGPPPLIYQIDSRELSFTSTWKPDNWINQTGNIVSIPDLEKAMIVIDPGRRVPDARRHAAVHSVLRSQIAPSRLTIAANGRRFTIEANAFRQAYTTDGHPLYIVDLVGKAGFPSGVGEAQFSAAGANAGALHGMSAKAKGVPAPR